MQVIEARETAALARAHGTVGIGGKTAGRAATYLDHERWHPRAVGPVATCAEEVPEVNEKSRSRRLVLSGLLAWVLAVGGAMVPAAAASVAAIDYPMPTPVATPPAVSPPASVALGVATSPALGPVLTDPSGMTLYWLSSDPTNGSVCTGGCLVNWPPLLVAAGGTVSGPSGSSLTLGTFIRPDNGTTQVTLNGHPLYTFAGDSAPGQTNGDGIVALGGRWHVASAASSFLGSLSTVSLRGSSTVPANGDINPTGWPSCRGRSVASSRATS